jgi:RNA polymerase sigma-70 factor (ECF subfamily)
VLGSWSTVGSYDQPAAFARRVLLNLAASSARRRRAELRALVRRGTGDGFVLAPELDEFWTLVRTLAPRQKQVVALFYADQRSVIEIAELLAISEGTVRATLTQARDRLRADLEGEDA